MSEETGLETWQREMRDGVGAKKWLRRAWMMSRWYILAWVFVLATAPFMVDMYGPYFVGGFIGLFTCLTIMRYLELREQWAHFGHIMGIVASMREKEGADE